MTLIIKKDSNNNWVYEDADIIYRTGTIKEDYGKACYMLKDHFSEVMEHVDPKDFHPNFDLVSYYERTGSWVGFAIQMGDMLVGYAWYSTNCHPFLRNSKSAQQHMIYIEPSVRSWKTYSSFIKFIEFILIDKYFVKYIISSCSFKNDFTPLLKRMGYMEFDKTFIKKVG